MKPNKSRPTYRYSVANVPRQTARNKHQVQLHALTHDNKWKVYKITLGSRLNSR